VGQHPVERGTVAVEGGFVRVELDLMYPEYLPPGADPVLKTSFEIKYTDFGAVCDNPRFSEVRSMCFTFVSKRIARP
jgi:hypothetical protein